MVTGDLKSCHFLGPPEGTGRSQWQRDTRTEPLPTPCLSHAPLWGQWATDQDGEYREPGTGDEKGNRAKRPQFLGREEHVQSF